MITKISHIAIVVEDLDEALRLYEQAFGLKAEEVRTTASRRSAIVPVGEGYIDISQPIRSEGMLSEFLKAHGEGIHHIALGTDDIEADVEALKKRGVKMVDEEPRTGAHGAKIAFISPRSTNGVSIELIDETNSPENKDKDLA